MNHQRGGALVEIIVATAVLATCIVSIYGAMQYSLRAAILATEKTQAAFLLDGMIDELKFIRDLKWIDIPSSGTHCLDTANSPILTKETATAPCTKLNGFTRMVVFSAYDPPDDNLRNAVMTVSWKSNDQTTRHVSANLVIGNIFRCDQ